jgi:hypothetical protein
MQIHNMGRLRKNVEDGILTKQYFTRAHTEQRKEMATGLIALGANSSLLVEAERGKQMSGPGKSCKEGLQTKQKDHSSLFTHRCSQSSRKMSLIQNEVPE